MKSSIQTDSSGFTLVEVILAIGITATVALPLLALLGMSHETSLDSELRFASSGIVHDIVADLRQSTITTGPVIAVGQEDDGTIEFWEGAETQSAVTLDGTEVFVGYDATGGPVREVSEAEYENGADDLVAFVARIVFEEVLPPSGEMESPRLLRASVSVKTPGSEERFTTLLNATNQFSYQDGSET